MKRILFTLIFTIAVFAMVKAQSNFITDEFGQVQPFSLHSPNWEIIRPDKISPNYITDSYNNDSLLWGYNDPDSIMIKRGVRCGKFIDSTRYSFKKMATHFDVGHGDIWLFKIISPTSAGLTVHFEKFDLPEGAYISSYRIKQTGPFLDYPRTYVNANIDDSYFRYNADGKELYVELYVPKIVDDSYDVFIESIMYYFSDERRIAMPEPPKKKMNRD